ncbi:DUF3054 domain-containing protein [Saxibacter everestensis]|uniref:DUF3054 domain-containing protein n=1 Tax=Saxibacter everestensis TaxID=2909229 RepID=A0ABY8QZ34_9MICO|nr:DUF3054 domain-containing protein [Brevibacteriaceae bacterium ZFBP1038]
MSSIKNSAPARQTSRKLALTAVVVDIALVLIFVLIGRRNHDEGFTIAGTLTTWWPFLAGLAIGWLVSRGWRKPLGLVVPGIVIWLATVAVGMLLRLASNQGAQPSFIIVATAVLGAFLLGWRALAILLVRRRREG